MAVAFAFHLLSVTGHVTEFLALQQLARYTLFFLLAAACHRNLAAWTSMLSRHGVWFVLAFLTALVALPMAWLPTIAGLLSLPAMLTVAIWIDRWPAIRDPLQFLGYNTLTIYLMSSLAMGLVRGIVVKFWGWDDWRFFVVAPALATGNPTVKHEGPAARGVDADRQTQHICVEYLPGLGAHICRPDQLLSQSFPVSQCPALRLPIRHMRRCDGLSTA